MKRLIALLVGLLAAIAIPNFVQARSTSNLRVCISNLRLIDTGAQSWAALNRKQPTDSYTLDDIKDYFQRNLIPQCPSGGQYGPNFTVGEPPTCTVAGHVLQ